MKVEDLKLNALYLYRGGGQTIRVKYLGRKDGRYRFSAYNDETGYFDGYSQDLDFYTVENNISR